jgi:hypothetical protein
MKIKTFAILLLGIQFSVFACKKAETSEVPNHRRGSSFYVDAKNGDDSNNGKTPAKAWKSLQKVNGYQFMAGDSLLFKAGDIWKGQLTPKGSGDAKNPIVVSIYSGTKKALLDGEGKVSEVVKLEDVDYWELNHLEITNNATTIGNRLGVLVKDNGASRKHIHLKNLYIHDIMGDYSFEMKGKNTGGIGIIGTAESKFDDILIEDCEIANVVRLGIFTNLTDGKKAVKGNRPITNLVIRRNKIHHCAGDGVIVRYSYRALVEHNEVWETHNADEELVRYGVALWCRSTDETIFQYNEVYHTRGGKDGQAFDADEDAYRTVIQYNYSHDNEGGFVLITSTSEDAIIRHNISVNDGIKGLHVFDFPVWANHVRGTAIAHNNTVVLNKAHEAVVIADEALTTSKFYNNIFYHEGQGELAVKSAGQTAVFNGNVYFGYDKLNVKDDKGIFTDPQLVNPLSYGKGFASAAGFKLKATSPILNKALAKSEMEGNYWLPDLGTKDFFETAINLSKFSPGAYQAK